MKHFIDNLLHKTSLVDWAISAILVITVVALAMWVCNHPEGDTTDSESFFPSFNSTQTVHETFADSSSTDSSSKATTLQDVSELQNMSENDIGCCLVYYDQCGHCQTFKPVWEKICRRANGKSIKGRTIRMFETGNDMNMSVWKEVSDRYGIQGYPTILVKIGGPGAQWKEYTGPRQHIAEYLMTQQE